ncbi:pentapeptide repeat-containing protein [Streptomyces sp. NBC_01438]|uniref:pentapeptide repeat-containing protein n=1 Tax=Streptomyces sp. NBC_01438 TaxID=2903866 RepID=UPI0032495BF9
MKHNPSDPEAARQLQEWDAEEGYSLYGIEHDFRGADLSGGDFTKAWFTQAVLAGVRLTGAIFYRADLQSADLTVDDNTVLHGLTGTVFGPITVFSGDSSRELAGAELEAWIGARGGQVQVIPPRRAPQ